MTDRILKAELAKRIGLPLERWPHNCHVVSLAIVKAGEFPGARVARGWCRGVMSQHSWVVIGDPYCMDTQIVDPTLWSYDAHVTDVWYGTQRDRLHKPHGHGSIYDWGRPCSEGGDVIEMDTSGLSEDAQDFLDLLGPLDWQGWHALLARAPVLEWPAQEIMEAAHEHPKLSAIIPVDRLGMVTDLNPGSLYLPVEGDPGYGLTVEATAP